MSIELKGVTKKFGGVPAVNNVTFSVKEGELMALLGPSGGGKTTVLRMIAGLELPTSGDVFIRGRRVNDLSVQQRNIGFVFQNYALFKNMTVFKNIAFGLKIKKWKAADMQSRIGELLKLFGLDGLEQRYPHQLSGGQRQRVAIARALINRPALVLADEPTGALDSGSGEQVMALLDDLNQRGQTILLVTHDAKLAAAHGRRIVTLRDGRVEDDARIEPRRSSEPRELVRLGAEEA
jgi:sulfate/thiosulfate transport system ATP-binding protein